MAHLRVLGALVLLAALLLPRESSGAKPTTPNVTWGKQARATIGTRIAEVARAHGISTTKLQTMLQDNDIGFDKLSSRLMYACEGMAVPTDVAPLATAEGTVAAAAIVGSATPGGPDPTDLSMAFKLHSRPGATKKLLLDFTGHTTTATAWNAWKGITSIVSPPYDIDSNPGAFSNTELSNIIKIWREVAEDFAAYDVDVTTEETDASGAPLNLVGVGARAVIGGSSNTWYGSGAGGVAYVNTFGQSYYEPAFVFPDQLGTGYPKYVWEAISHELGHRLGLSHDGTSTVGYYQGHANWAPIMGVGYYKPISQWSKGEYTDANNLEDDLSIIRNYLPTRADDYGNTAATATPLSGSPLPTDASRLVSSAIGNIETTGDTDFFSFAASAGSATLTLAITPDARSNLDTVLRVYAPGAATPLLEQDVTGSTLLQGSFPVNLPAAGTYAVSLTGTGDGADGKIGYTNYGSLGEYKLTVEWPAPAVPSPVPSPSPSPPPPSPPPPPPPVAKTITTALSGTVGYASGKKSYTVQGTVTATDSAGVRITGASAFVSGTWGYYATATSYKTTAFSGYTSTSTGALTVKSPGAVKGPMRMTITGVTLTGYTWDKANTIKDFTF